MGMPGPTELLVLFFLLAAGAMVLLLLVGMKRSSGGTSGSEARDPRKTLDERYAQGELTRDDYQQMRQDIESS